jgi:tetratricopeptide (TPR) repeat protein
MTAFKEHLGRADRYYAKKDFIPAQQHYEEAGKIMPLPKEVIMRLQMIKCAEIEKRKSDLIEASRKKMRFSADDYSDYTVTKKEDIPNVSPDIGSVATGKKKDASSPGGPKINRKLLLTLLLLVVAVTGLLVWYGQRVTTLRRAQQIFNSLVARLESGEYNREELRHDFEHFAEEYSNTPYARAAQAIFRSTGGILKGNVVRMLLGFVEQAGSVEEQKLLTRLENEIAVQLSEGVKEPFVEGIVAFKAQSYVDAVKSWMKSLDQASIEEKDIVIDCVKLTNALIQKNLQEYQSWLKKAQEYEEQGKHQAAVDAYLKALLINPDDKFALQSIERLGRHFQ